MSGLKIIFNFVWTTLTFFINTNKIKMHDKMKEVVIVQESLRLCRRLTVQVTRRTPLNTYIVVRKTSDIVQILLNIP